MKKKILILTVDCWNTKIGANTATTYSTLFNGMDEYELANIYIREELPDDPCCKKYFQISERRIIKNLLKKSVKTGKEVENVTVADSSEDVALQKEFYSKQRKSFYYTKKIIRELIWYFGKWKTKELDAFLKEVNPDLVIFAMEGYIHFNRICRYAINKTGAKAIAYFWDDNFTYKQRPNNFGYKFLRFFQRKSLKKLAKCTDAFWAISSKTKKEADKFFGIDCTILQKPTERDMTDAVLSSKEHTLPLKMLYAGNLMIGRMNTIDAIRSAVRLINKDETKVIFDVYTPTEVPKYLVETGYGINFHKPVSQKEIIEFQNDADVLWFVEDIIGQDKKVARLSISTKVADYLSSGKCIIAAGDDDTATIEYFKNENVALCAHDKDEIYDCIRRILANPELIDVYGKRAFECAKKNHSKDTVKAIMSDSIQEVLK